MNRLLWIFYCADARLVIELDGSQHYTEQGKAYDEERSAILHGYGLKVFTVLLIGMLTIILMLYARPLIGKYKFGYKSSCDPFCQKLPLLGELAKPLGFD